MCGFDQLEHPFGLLRPGAACLDERRSAGGPLFPIPPYTGTPEDPILLPIIFDGSAGAQVEVEIRRLWSAESGLEAPEPEPEEP